jgi:predicted DNA-binding protein
MVRKQIYLEYQQEKRLKQLSRKLGLTEAELIRQAIDNALATDVAVVSLSSEVWEQEKGFIRSLIGQGPVSGGRRWTRQELYGEQ